MDRLPLETKREIAGLIHQHPPSLRAFACVNWECYYVASAYLFHTLEFEVIESQDVNDLTEHYSKRLRRTSAFGHVRCIKIHDRLDDYMPNKSAEWWRCRREAQRLLASEIKHNELWLPLAGLVKQLSGLSSLVFGGSYRLPGCFLDVLHQHNPRCRLHMDDYRPRNADGTPIAEGKLNTSPCLHSIRYRWGEGYWHSISPADHELAMQVVSRLAPNLKKVTCTHVTNGQSSLSSDAVEFKADSGNQQRASLDTLILSNPCYISASEIDDWYSHTDFSALETLHLKQNFRTESTLRYIMANVQLPRLKELFLGFTWQYEGYSSEETSENARDFLQWLPPLKSLTIFGWSPRDLPGDSFLVHQGACLVELSLAPWIEIHPTLSDLRQIIKNCPLLESLAISMRRTCGDEREVALYRLIGSLPKLLHLTLDLDVLERPRVPRARIPLYNEDLVNQWLISESLEALPDHDVFRDIDLEVSDIDWGSDEVLLNGRVRGALINTAIDGTLATSIFRAISSGKPKGSLPLERLDMKALKVGEFVRSLDVIRIPGGISDVFKVLAKQWRVERNPRDDTDELVATETGEPERYMDAQVTPFPGMFKPWRCLWPQSESGDWRDEWHSLPLSL